MRMNGPFLLMIFLSLRFQHIFVVIVSRLSLPEGPNENGVFVKLLTPTFSPLFSLQLKSS